MKANEAPERIYIHKSPYWGLMANENNTTENDIEYIRTDAFIEKACEWIKMMWSETDDRFEQDFTGMLIEDFKNYMKGW